MKIQAYEIALAGFWIGVGIGVGLHVWTLLMTLADRLWSSRGEA